VKINPFQSKMRPESRLSGAIDTSPQLHGSLIGIQVAGFAVERIIISCGNVGYAALEIQLWKS
jgi:hypothetical protein